MIKPSAEVTRELIGFWNVPKLCFLAHYVETREGRKQFRNIRKPDGSACRFPDGRELIINSLENNYEEGTEYEIHAFVAPENKRMALGKQYLLWLDTKNSPPKKLTLTPELHIAKLAHEYESPKGIARETLKGLIKRLAVETNKKPETFIYELLQNADDYPDLARKRVNIRFQIINQYLVVTHNGQEFLPNNVHALCSVDAGDKALDRKKTGYKGIGFKSLFKHSDYVWVHSGGYSFRFDERFHRNRGEETFWQVIPVWTNQSDVDPAINLPEVTGAPVSFVIRPKEGISKLLEYEKTFLNVFQDERVLLFLRSVATLSYQSSRHQFTKEKSGRNWEISEEMAIDVPEDLRNRINRLIDQDIDGRIPEKYKGIEKAGISFATNLVDGKIVPTQEAKVYAYLPTDLNFGFPFLLNSDFIPDGSREKLFWDLEWNAFLFRTAAMKLLDWMAALWLKQKDTGVILMFPDLERLITEEKDSDKLSYLQIFKEGLLEGIKNIVFTPDIRGLLHPLSDLLFDDTGFTERFGEDTFRRLTKNEASLIHPSFRDHKPLYDLSAEAELGDSFTWETLKEDIANADFTEWLKTPVNNASFLRFLFDSGQLEAFTDTPIYLDQNGDLRLASELYRDLGEDWPLLDWLGVCCLHPVVNSKLSDITMPIDEYAAIDFVESYIIRNKSEVDDLINDWTNSKKFYQFLFKYHNELPENLFSDEKKIRWFKIHNGDGEVVNSMTAQPLFLEGSVVEKLKSAHCFPNETFDIISGKNYQIVGDNGLRFWDRLGIRTVTKEHASQIVDELFINKDQAILKHYKQLALDDTDDNVRSNATLWMFLEEIWTGLTLEGQKKAEQTFSNLPVLTSDNFFLSLNQCYLPHHYTGNKALENIAEQQQVEDMSFVSDQYIKLSGQTNSTNWLSLFKRFKVRSNEEELIREYILPRLESIDPTDLMGVTQLIFKYRRQLENEIPNLQLSVRTRSGAWIPAEEALIGAPYIDTVPESGILASIELANSISADYSENKYQEWVAFFKKLGCTELVTTEQLIAWKIDQALGTWTEESEPDPTHKHFVDELIGLHSAEMLTESHFSQLSGLPLQIKGSAILKAANELFLSTEYQPTVDLETLVDTNDIDLNYVSPIYLRTGFDRSEVVALLKKVGASDRVRIVNSKMHPRLAADSAYISSLDRKDVGIKMNAHNDNKAHLHHIESHVTFTHHSLLNIPVIVDDIWKQILGDADLRQSVFQPAIYVINSQRKIQVDTEALWLLKINETIRCIDGKYRKPSELVSSRFGELLGDPGRFSFINMSGIEVSGKSIEVLLEFKYQLDLPLCVDAINFIKDHKRLKKLQIYTQISNLLTPGQNLLNDDRKALEKLREGELPNQLGEWRPTIELVALDLKVKTGMAKHPSVLANELTGIAKVLGLRILTDEDFTYEHIPGKEEDFKSRLHSRLKFIALAEAGEDWAEKQEALVTTLSEWNFVSARRIKITYSKVDPSIEYSESRFYKTDKTAYYMGAWSGVQAAEFIQFVHKELLALKSISEVTFIELLINELSEILDYFREKNIEYPESWEVKSSTQTGTPPGALPSHVSRESAPQSAVSTLAAKPVTKAPSQELSESEVQELEKLFNRSLSEDEIANHFIVALFRAIKSYEDLGYDLSNCKKDLDECIGKRMLEGVISPDQSEVKRILVRSARRSILRLNYNAWIDLSDGDTELFVLTGTGTGEYYIFRSPEELAALNEDSWVARIGGKDKWTEIQDLLDGRYTAPDKKFAPMQFIIRLNNSKEYQSIFEQILNNEQEPDFDDLG